MFHVAVVVAKLLGTGGVRAVVAENLLLKQQLIVLRRPRRRAPNLTVWDRFLFGYGSLFLSPGRICKVAIGLQPSTLLKFHEVLVRRKYRRLFSSSHWPKKPGPKGPSADLIRVIVELAYKPHKSGFLEFSGITCVIAASLRGSIESGCRWMSGFLGGSGPAKYSQRAVF